jgi:hypothetical protein
MTWSSQLYFSDGAMADSSSETERDKAESVKNNASSTGVVGRLTNTARYARLILEIRLVTAALNSLGPRKYSH